MQNKFGNFCNRSDRKSANVDFYVKEDDLNGAQDGEKVTFNLESWVDRRALPQAKFLADWVSQGLMMQICYLF